MNVVFGGYRFSSRARTPLVGTQLEEFHIAGEVAKEGEEVCITRKRRCEWTFQVHVVTANALECQIEPVGNPSVKPPSAVDGLFTIYLVAGEYHHSTDGVADCSERLVLLLGKLFSDWLKRLPPRECRYH